jgi:hypothetical protein
VGVGTGVNIVLTANPVTVVSPNSPPTSSPPLSTTATIHCGTFPSYSPHHRGRSRVEGLDSPHQRQRSGQRTG